MSVENLEDEMYRRNKYLQEHMLPVEPQVHRRISYRWFDIAW